MKVLTAEQIRSADAYTIQHEPIASIDLMERASKAIFEWLQNRYATATEFIVLAGPGNNGGDGLAVARLLHLAGFNVQVCCPVGAKSNDCKVNSDRLIQLEIPIVELADLQVDGQVIVDALFGTGLTRAVEGPCLNAIEWINRSGMEVVSIDIPSGLPSDGLAEAMPVVKASHTLSFQVPKPVFFDPACHAVLGDWQVLDIRLDKEYMAQLPYNESWLLPQEVSQLVRARGRFDHKGSYGHAILMGGSKGMMGAIQMACSTALRSGAGLVSAHVPGHGYEIMQTGVPEAMVLPGDADEVNELWRMPKLPAKANALGVGPGLSTGQGPVQLIKQVIDRWRGPLVLDADALNILSENKTWLDFLPPMTILTPHPGEFARLIGEHDNHTALKQGLKDFCTRYGLVVVLKGGYTMIGAPSGVIYHNTTGNAGMASGGMGDVLTGLITGLLAQGYASVDAALIGVAAHAAAGDRTAEQLGLHGVTASEVLQRIGKVLSDWSNE